MNESWKNTHGASRSESLGIYEIIHDWPLWGLEASGSHNLPFRAITYTGMTEGAALSMDVIAIAANLIIISTETIQ